MIAEAKSEHPRVEPLAEPIVEAATPPQDAKRLISKEGTSQFDVSNVLGIIPPVQTAPDASVEPAVPIPQTFTALAANTRQHGDTRLGDGERIGTITSIRSLDRPLTDAPPVPTSPVVVSSHAPYNAQPADNKRVAQFTSTIPLESEQPSFPTFGDNPASVAVAKPDSAPANFAAPAVPHIPAEMTVSAHDTRNTLPPPVTEPIFAVSEATNVTGMVAAKPGLVMPSATLQRVQPTAPAVTAEPASNAAMADTLPAEAATSPRSTAVLSARNGRENSAEDNAANTDRNPTTEFSAMDLPRVVATASTGAHSSAPVRSTDVAQIVTHTLQASEQLRATGLQRMEVAVKLDSGHDLTIQLRIENGQVTPVIRTASEPLRTALEQNWSLFAQRTGDRELRISTPVFESPQTSSNMSDLNQQRDGHQRAFNEPAPENFQSSPQRRNTPPQIPRPASTSAGLAEGVRLYA